MRKYDILEKVYQSDLPSRAKQIMFYLINRANTEGTCFPSNKTIAKDCGISTRTVQRVMIILVERGFIKKDSRFREQGGQTSNLYSLQMTPEQNETIENVTFSDYGVETTEVTPHENTTENNPHDKKALGNERKFRKVEQKRPVQNDTVSNFISTGLSQHCHGEGDNLYAP